MKCMVRLENRGEWRGPFEVRNVDSIVIDGAYLRNIPRSWTLGIENGWMIWEGGNCPVHPETIAIAAFRDGCISENSQVASMWRWTHNGGDGDVVAYRIVKQPKTLDQAWDEDEDKMPDLPTVLCTSEPLEDVYEIVYDNATGKKALYDRRAETQTVEDNVSLSMIMDRSVWWLEDTIWRAVAECDHDNRVDEFRLTNGMWVSRDWFTGREYKRSEEFGL